MPYNNTPITRTDEVTGTVALPCAYHEVFLGHLTVLLTDQNSLQWRV